MIEPTCPSSPDMDPFRVTGWEQQGSSFAEDETKALRKCCLVCECLVCASVVHPGTPDVLRVETSEAVPYWRTPSVSYRTNVCSTYVTRRRSVSVTRA